ncbi:MAG: hypothetical protein methR_P0395 [Methyloprofundus sp.]|nr:MAG: hypothetical protein methR_P0395 [Methyloprofundus sp.]
MNSKYPIVILFVLMTQQVNAGILENISHIYLPNTVPTTAELVEKYQVSDEQLQEMQEILMTELPKAVPSIVALLNNRNELLQLTRTNADYDADAIRAIAQAQGRLITTLIIWKESLKYQLYSVLEPDQQALIDESIDAFLAFLTNGTTFEPPRPMAFLFGK